MLTVYGYNYEDTEGKMMGAVRLLVTGVYDTMCDCFFL